MLQTGLKTGTG